MLNSKDRLSKESECGLKIALCAITLTNIILYFAEDYFYSLDKSSLQIGNIKEISFNILQFVDAVWKKSKKKGLFS